MIWTTGYVISERAIKEVGISNLQTEYGPFTSEDLYRLLPSETELLTRLATLDANREISHRKNKEHKKRNRNENASNEQSQVHSESGKSVLAEEGPVDNHPSKSLKSRSGSNKKLASTSATSVASNKISAEKSVIDSAQNAVQQQVSKSEVYKKMFHDSKDASNTKSDRDLFMSVAGLRYTLG